MVYFNLESLLGQSASHFNSKEQSYRQNRPLVRACNADLENTTLDRTSLVQRGRQDNPELGNQVVDVF